MHVLNHAVKKWNEIWVLHFLSLFSLVWFELDLGFSVVFFLVLLQNWSIELRNSLLRFNSPPMAYQHYATTTATNPNPIPPPPPYLKHYVQASVPFPSTPQFSTQGQFHFSMAMQSRSLQCNPAPQQWAWVTTPYLGIQGQPPQSNPTFRGYVWTRRGCPPPQHTIPSQGGLFYLYLSSSVYPHFYVYLMLDVCAICFMRNVVKRKMLNWD